MKDKELIDIIDSVTILKRTLGNRTCDCKTCSNCVDVLAAALNEAGYRKVPKDAIVLHSPDDVVKFTDDLITKTLGKVLKIQVPGPSLDFDKLVESILIPAIKAKANDNSLSFNVNSFEFKGDAHPFDPDKNYSSLYCDIEPLDMKQVAAMELYCRRNKRRMDGKVVVTLTWPEVAEVDKEPENQ